MRGLAILAVILVHSQGAVGAGSLWLQSTMAAGARGVQLFYVASALTLCLSWAARSTRESSPVRNFYLRRLFRIVPMFYVAIVAYVMLYGLAPRYYAPDGVRWFYVPLTAAFLHGFHPETITSVVPGGWSIAVEMTFYLLFPLLVRWSRTKVSLGLLLAGSLAFAWVAARLAYAVFGPAYPEQQRYLVDTLSELNFLSQLPVFVFGIIAYRLMQHPHARKRAIVASVIVSAGWLASAFTLGPVALHTVSSSPVAMGALFALLALMLERRPGRVLVNPVTVWVGKLSFSMYLSHFAVIDAFTAAGISGRFGQGDRAALLHYLCVVAVTAGVSWACYRIIERPGIAAGRRLIARLEPRPFALHAEAQS